MSIIRHRFLTIVCVAVLIAISNPFADAAESHIWTDRTGKHSSEATFLDIVDEKVKLRSSTKKIVEIPILQLSVDDLDYLRKLLTSNESQSQEDQKTLSKLDAIPVTPKEMEEYRRNLKIPRDSFTVSASSVQYGEEIEKAFDGDVNTIWHSEWEVKNAYPYRVEIAFDATETVTEFHYLPRQYGVNGFVLKYEIAALADDSDWETVLSGSLPATSQLQVFRFPPISCKKLRFDILEGASGLASAAEFEIYRPDPEAEQIAQLFADRSFSSLKKDGKGRVSPEVKARITELRAKPLRRDLREDFAIAMRLAKPKDAKDAKGVLERYVVTVPPKPSVNQERTWKRDGFAWSPFQPTGQSVQQGQIFNVYLESASNAPKPKLLIVNFRNYDWNDQARVPLQPGRNVIVAPKNGLLYLDNSCDDPAMNNEPSVVHFEKTVPFPFYQHGKTTPEEWAEMKREPNSAGMLELCSGRVLITITEEIAKKQVKNPQKLCAAFEELMDVYARLLGFGKDEPPPHGIPKNLIHITEVTGDCLYATEYRTAFSSNNMYFVLDPRLIWNDSWGTWHEIGHMHQVQPYKFQNLGEVTVNIFSLEIQNQHGQKARIDTPEMKEQMAVFFNDPNRDYHKIDDVFHKLVMFWQLRLAFGDNFYPKLHRYYRENDLPIHNDEDRVQYFIRVSSKISGYNLTPFFLAWGLKPNDETLAEIRKQKELTVPIWRNTNLSNAPKEGVVAKYRKSK